MIEWARNEVKIAKEKESKERREASELIRGVMGGVGLYGCKTN